MLNNSILSLAVIGVFVLMIIVGGGAIELFFYLKDKLEQIRYEKRTRIYRNKVCKTWRNEK